MSRVNDRPVKEVISQLFKENSRKQKFDETALIAAWPRLMGPAVASRTEKLYIRNQKLVVKLSSSVLRNEMVMMRSKIIEHLNGFAGQQLINDIIFQ